MCRSPACIFRSEARVRDTCRQTDKSCAHLQQARADQTIYLFRLLIGYSWARLQHNAPKPSQNSAARILSIGVVFLAISAVKPVIYSPLVLDDVFKPVRLSENGDRVAWTDATTNIGYPNFAGHVDDVLHAYAPAMHNISAGPLSEQRDQQGKNDINPLGNFLSDLYFSQSNSRHFKLCITEACRFDVKVSPLWRRAHAPMFEDTRTYIFDSRICHSVQMFSGHIES